VPSLSPQTVYQRFFSVRRLLPEEAHVFANVDYHRQMAVVAEVDDGQAPELVGVARYGLSDEGTADIGVVVADAWQGLGLGSLLLDEILRAGEQRGIHEFSAEVLTDNRRALRLLARRTAITRRTVSSGVTSVVFGRRADSALEARGDTTSRSSHVGPTWRRCNSAALRCALRKASPRSPSLQSPTPTAAGAVTSGAWFGPIVRLRPRVLAYEGDR